jgi:hypothetical protein
MQTNQTRPVNNLPFITFGRRNVTVASYSCFLFFNKNSPNISRLKFGVGVGVGAGVGVGFGVGVGVGVPSNHVSVYDKGGRFLHDLF